MKTVEEIQKLLRCADSISTAVKAWQDTYTKDSSCDKKGFGFNQDNRFAACDPLKLSVDSWKGYYGNSGCSTILSVDAGIFNGHLLKVLRRQFWQLLQETEQSIRDEAKTHKEAAQQELAEKLKSIDAL